MLLGYVDSSLRIFAQKEKKNLNSEEFIIKNSSYLHLANMMGSESTDPIRDHTDSINPNSDVAFKKLWRNSSWLVK